MHRSVPGKGPGSGISRSIPRAPREDRPCARHRARRRGGHGARRRRRGDARCRRWPGESAARRGHRARRRPARGPARPGRRACRPRSPRRCPRPRPPGPAPPQHRQRRPRPRAGRGDRRRRRRRRTATPSRARGRRPPPQGALVAGTPCTVTARACVDILDRRAWLLENGAVTRGPVHDHDGRPGRPHPDRHLPRPVEGGAVHQPPVPGADAVLRVLRRRRHRLPRRSPGHGTRADA